MKNTFHVEITDTFGGEANYSWKRQYLVKANTSMGAMRKAAREFGYEWRKDWDNGDTVRYNAKNACICAFVMFLDESSIASFNGVTTL